MEQPVISFTFDDFPRSAWLAGGAILRRFGVRGTYYASLGLLGSCEVSGEIFVESDLRGLLKEGHELGCHTFSHCHSWNTESLTFERSIIQNQLALSRLIPGGRFETFSYPMSPPRPATKWRTGSHFLCCRCSGQRINVGTIDLNQLSAVFLEKLRHRMESIQEIIDENRVSRGWLILATHDISDQPSAYGCTADELEAVVAAAVASGAHILPVREACRLIRA